jgi:hypothetical protein
LKLAKAQTRRDQEATLMPKPSTVSLKNVMVDKDAFESIMRKLIASPPIRQPKPKRKAPKTKQLKRNGE